MNNQQHNHLFSDPVEPILILSADTWEWAARVLGAVAGSAISIAYLLPNSIREAALRFLTGIGIGLIFGTMAGHELASYLNLRSVLSAVEITLIGSTSASLCAWWGLGILARISERYTR